MAEILRLENINYSYIDGGFERQILKDLSYTFEDHRFYTILGPSGSGKTTLLSIIAGLDTPKSGKIYYADEDIEKIRRAVKRFWAVDNCGVEIVDHFRV